MSLLHKLPPLSECSIDYFDSEQNIISKIHQLGGCVDDYSEIKPTLLNKNLLSLIEILSLNIFELEKENEKLKNKLKCQQKIQD
jgi:hypothetical protein